MKRKVFAGLVVGALLATGVYMILRPKGEQAATASTVGQKQVPATAASGMFARQAGNVAAESPELLAAKRRMARLKGARDMSVYLDELARRSEPGEAMYAEYVASSCSLGTVAIRTAELQLARENKLPSDEQVRAKASLSRFCGSLTGSELTTRMLDWRKKQRTDPYFVSTMSLVNLISKADGRAEKKQAVEHLLATQDPYLLSIAGPPGMAALIPLPLAAGNGYFNGKRLGEADLIAVTVAWSLLQCELGMQCNGERDPILLNECASGRCFANRRELALDLLKDKGVSSERMDGFLVQLRDVLARRDAEAFLLPPGATPVVDPDDD